MRSRLAVRFAVSLALGSLALLGARTAGAWGTVHPDITREALRAVPGADHLETRLGGARQLEYLCWNPDYQGDVEATFYVDDYLLFPEFPHYSQHILPSVRETWKPFFLRTLQAMRGESPENAARWLGSLLHFVEDTGSPPHAFPISGPLHTRMENYIWNFQVQLHGYQPRDFGHTDDAAVEAFVQRLEGLVAYSRERGEKLAPLAADEKRAESEPLELECALETTRVVADVTHSLLVLSAAGPRRDSATIRGTIHAPINADFPQAPTQVLVEGTRFSTIAIPTPGLPGDEDYEAGFSLGDLPPGTYFLDFVRPGCRTLHKKVTFHKHSREVWNVDLGIDSMPGNLVRNADFSVRWLRPGDPDHWSRLGAEWVSEPIRVIPGEIYELGARYHTDVLPVAARESDDPHMPAASHRLELFGDNHMQPAASFIQLIVKSDTEPTFAFARRVPARH